MDQELEKYGHVAAFIAVLLRLIYDGPLELDNATALQTLALVARFAETAGGEPVTADALQNRLHGLARHAKVKVADREAAVHLATQDGPHCIFFPWIGWECFYLHQTGTRPDQI
jgi:hypothetical protein